MERHETDELVREADRLRVKYLDAFNRHDLETALRIGAEELMPVSERLAEGQTTYYNPFAITAMNLSVMCQQLQRPISGFFFAQRAFQATVLLDMRKVLIHNHLRGIVPQTFNVAADVADLSRGAMSDSERQMIMPAAALVPETIDMARRIGEFPMASQMRAAVTRLRTLTVGPDVDVVDHESRSMVWLARFAHARGDRAVTMAEIGAALTLWMQQLDSGQRFWSSGLLETWTVAAELLDSLSLHESAAAVRRAIEQAVGSRGGFLGLSGVGEVLDLRSHYRAALQGLRAGR
jgi:hypothetical protein